MDNQALYLTLLQKFAASQADAPRQIEAALAAGDNPTAERIAHTLTGLAGTIGAQALQDQADALEDAVHTGGDAAAALPGVKAALSALIAALQAVVPAPGEAAVAPSAGATVQRDVLTAPLLSLLQAGDADAQLLFAEHEAGYAAVFGAHFKAVQGAIADFAFDEALALVSEALKESPDPT